MQKWKTGRGKMGFVKPLLGSWQAVVPDTPMGKVLCHRRFEEILDGKFIRLIADWNIGNGAKRYQEVAHYGLNREKTPAFWSFTSDGGTSYGEMADVSEMHEDARGFIAEMPSGQARLGFWPNETGMIWGADAKTKNGWSAMIRHTCERI